MKTKQLFLFYLLFSFLFLSCEDKNEKENMQNVIIGAWQLSSVQIDGANADLTAYPDIIQFQSNHIFESYNTTTETKARGGWSYEGNMLNISVYLPAAFYVLEAGAQQLILKRLDFNAEGTLRTTILEYRRTDNESITKQSSTIVN